MSDVYERYERAAALREQAKNEALAGRLRDAEELLRKMDLMPVADDVEWERAAAWNQLAKLLFETGYQADARSAWQRAISYARAGEQGENVQHSLDSSSVLWEIAETLALEGEWSQAEQVAQQIRAEIKRDHAIDALARIRSGGSRSRFSDQWTSPSESSSD